MKFRKDSFYLWNLCLLIGSIFLAVIGMLKIIRNISEGNPTYDQNAIVSILIGLDIGIASFLWMSMPGIGVVGDERTRKAGAKASLYALLILLGCLLLLGGVESFWMATKDSRLTPFILANIGIFSWGVISYYFLKKGDVE
ncbi:MAG: DUF2178 domain-containing protein [Candidatus Methanoperedens sp.]|nr:DUF2178 domain-containing protein [Candidatus Methanoperedens sp.]